MVCCAFCRHPQSRHRRHKEGRRRVRSRQACHRLRSALHAPRSRPHPEDRVSCQLNLHSEQSRTRRSPMARRLLQPRECLKHCCSCTSESTGRFSGTHHQLTAFNPFSTITKSLSWPISVSRGSRLPFRDCTNVMTHSPFAAPPLAAPPDSS